MGFSIRANQFQVGFQNQSGWFNVLVQAADSIEALATRNVSEG